MRRRPIEIRKVWAAQGILDAYGSVRKVKRPYKLADARRVAADLWVTLVVPAVSPPDATLARLAVHGLESATPGLGGMLTLNLWQRLLGGGGSISTAEDLVTAAPDALEAGVLLAAAEAPSSREDLDTANADAVALSCFGIPLLMADGESYFGQDRLELMERRLGSAQPLLAPDSTPGSNGGAAGGVAVGEAA